MASKEKQLQSYGTAEKGRTVSSPAAESPEQVHGFVAPPEPGVIKINIKSPS